MKTYIVFSLMIIAGLIVMLIQVNIAPENFFYPFLRQISGVLLIGGTLSLLYKVFVDKDNREFLLKTFNIHKSIEQNGLTRIIPDFQGERTNAYIDLIDNSVELFILMNYGFSWIENYSSYLEKRFNEKTTTEFYLIDENGIFLPSIAKKMHFSEESQKMKIQDAKDNLIKIYNRSNKKGVLKIYGLKNYPTYTLLASEDRAFLIPYFTSEGYKIPPLFEFKLQNKNSFVSTLIKEFDDLRNTSIIEFNSNDKEEKTEVNNA